MKINSLIAIATLFIFGQGAWAQHFEADPYDTSKPDGSQDNPFIIQSIQDLNFLAEDINNGFNTEKCFKLTTNLDFNGSNFTPIGYNNDPERPNGETAFQGVFDGDGYSISGIKITGDYDIGLFGFIYGPTIKNLTLSNSQIVGYSGVGGIVGSTAGDTHTIENCHVTSDVKITGSGEDSYMIGGIVGCNETGTITNCTSAAEVRGYEAVGGIAGSISNLTQFTELTDCYYLGEENKVSGSKNVGLIVGENDENLIPNITLFDKDDDEIKNETRLKIYDSQVCNVTLSGRTLYKDDSWNTLCLPFNLTEDQIEEDDCPLNDATIMSLDYATSKFENGTLTMNFTKATEISNKMPYIVKWAQGSDEENPVFNGVKVEFNETAISHEDADVVFMDVYNTPKVIEGEDNTILYLGAGNTLYYPSAAMTINAFRGYFQLQNGLTAGETTSEEPGNPETTSNSIKAFVLNFGDEEMGIREISTPSNSSNSSNLSNSYFTLDGRRLNGQPTQSGIFIHGGKKVILP